MDVVKANKPRLIRWLRGDELILQHVQSKNLITDDEYDKINSISDPGQKTTGILDLMLRKGDGVCRDFLEMLKKDEVNESSPELRTWITTVDISSSSSSAVPKSTGNISGTTVNIQAQGGSHVSAPILSNNNIRTLNTNMNQAPPKTQDGKMFIDSETFLRKNRSNLVQKVKCVDAVVDKLDLPAEIMANVQSKSTDQDKMRLVLDSANSKVARENLIQVLENHCPDVMEELNDS